MRVRGLTQRRLCKAGTASEADIEYLLVSLTQAQPHTMAQRQAQRPAQRAATTAAPPQTVAEVTAAQ